MSESEKDNDLVAGFEFDDLLVAALREKGLMIPVSIEEVEKAEAEIDEESVQLPKSLENPFSFLQKTSRSKVLRFQKPPPPLTSTSSTGEDT